MFPDTVAFFERRQRRKDEVTRNRGEMRQSAMGVGQRRREDELICSGGGIRKTGQGGGIRVDPKRWRDEMTCQSTWTSMWEIL